MCWHQPFLSFFLPSFLSSFLWVKFLCTPLNIKEEKRKRKEKKKIKIPTEYFFVVSFFKKAVWLLRGMGVYGGAGKNLEKETVFSEKNIGLDWRIGFFPVCVGCYL